MRTHKEIIRDAGTAQDVADQLGAKVFSVNAWKARDSIPPRYWARVVANGWATLEELAVAKAAA